MTIPFRRSKGFRRKGIEIIYVLPSGLGLGRTIKYFVHRQVSGDYQRLAYIINDYQGVHFERLSF